MADLSQCRPVLASKVKSRALPLHLEPTWLSRASCLYSQPRETSSNSVLEDSIVSVDPPWVLSCPSSTSSAPLERCCRHKLRSGETYAPPAAFESPWPWSGRCSSSIQGKPSQACSYSSSSLPWRRSTRH
uniref:Uncharacterized protein n=1 Tax=Triticum urartu TaxID=4572 RepID=A0A8R7PCP2_TRIUA